MMNASPRKVLDPLRRFATGLPSERVFCEGQGDDLVTDSLQEAYEPGASIRIIKSVFS